MPRYIDALLMEAALYRHRFSKHCADTVYIGGGTPSCLPEGLVGRLLSGLRDVYHIAPQAQITIEVNPGTANAEKFSEYAQGGVNRLSIGMQTDDDALLKTLGRVHTHAQFLQAYRQAKDAGFDDINIDLMFGLPGQSVEMFQNTLQNTIVLNPAHISAYSLKLEENTPFYQKYHGQEIISEADERRMYHLAVRMLKSVGYMHYETSNFAKKGFESRHNMKYWRQGETLGLGAAAHSYYLENGLPVRTQNTACLNEYMNAIEKNQPPVTEKTVIDNKEQLLEYIMLRLRLSEGISYQDFNMRFGLDFKEMFLKEIVQLQKARLIHADEKGIRPLLKGFDLQNTLITEFIKKI